MKTKMTQTIQIFDGAMGSELVKAGLAGHCPEDLNLTHPEIIQAIHQSYADADYITTNTFGLNRLKYKGDFPINLVAEAAVVNARTTGKIVFFDIGPTGKLLRPLGNVDFDDAYLAFAEVVLASRDLVDGYLLETFSDLYELKAAILAVKENSDKPVFVTMTFDKMGRTLTGTTPEIMVAFLEQMGVDALGVNCSLGPKDLSSIVERILACSHTPVIVQPNRGLPRLENGVSVYDLGVEEFCESVGAFAAMGVRLLGGCCGTTPEFIGSIAKYKGQEIKRAPLPMRPVLTSYATLVALDSAPTVKALTLNDNTSVEDCEDLAYDVLDLADDGIDVVELVSDGVEPPVLRTLIEKIQSLTSVPLRLKSNTEALCACFVRYYNGTT